MKVSRVQSALVVALLCTTVQATEQLDRIEHQFAQAKPGKSDDLPLSRDELFGTKPAPAKPAPKQQPLPQSKDELFGTPPVKSAPPAPAPASREDLFGLPPKQTVPAPTEVTTKAPALAQDGVKWSGFFNEEIAYTTGEPGHWSRAVSRFQLNGQGSFAGLKYKISARVDADPVYMSSDFYPDKVQDDQQHDFFLRENYVDFSASGLDFRVGRQQIVWGEVVGLFFADVVSARDMREFILPSFDILRIPQWAARAEYFEGDFHAEAIWIPVQSVDEIGEFGADFYPAGRIGEALAGPNVRFASQDEPSHSLSNSAWGLRMNTLVGGWDLAAFYYRSFSTTPAFHREVQGADTVFTPRHARIWQVGSTLSKDFGDFVLRAEAVYTNGQAYNVTTLTDADGVQKRNSFDYVLSFDFSLPRDTRLNLQAFQRIVSGDEDDIAPRTDGFGGSVLLSTKITPAWEPQILWIQSFSGGADRLIRPRLNWYVRRNTTLAFGADIFAGPRERFFGNFANRDRVYTELRYDF